MPITNSLRETLCATAYDVFLETFRRQSYLEPEKKLMLAVLENGVECFQKYAFARDRKKVAFPRGRVLGPGHKSRLAVFVYQRMRNPGICSRVFAARSSRVESRKVGEPGKGQYLSAGLKEPKEKERHCRNRKSQTSFAQSCQLMSVWSIASISRRMRQRRFSKVHQLYIDRIRQIEETRKELRLPVGNLKSLHRNRAEEAHEPKFLS